MIGAFHKHAVIDRIRDHCLSLHDTSAEAALQLPRSARPDAFEVAPVLVTVERLPIPETAATQGQLL